MEKLEKIEIPINELSNLPLFFRHIQCNQVTNIEDEEYVMKYDSFMQTKIFCDNESSRLISKTVNFKIFEKDAE